MAASSRRILPAPPAKDQSGTSSGSASNTDAALQVGRRRQHTLQACQSCKTRKTKCDGQRPCQLCVRKSTECVYIPNEPQSRLEAVKREKEELARTVGRYETVLSHLRTGPMEDATVLLESLRKANSLDAMIELIEHGALLLPNSANSAKSSESGKLSTSPVDGNLYSASEPGSATSPTSNSGKRTFNNVDDEDGEDSHMDQDDDTTPRKPTDASRPEAGKEHPEQADYPSMPRSSHKQKTPTKERRLNTVTTRLSLSILTGPSFNIRYVANASDWTSVTSDSGMVSHLLSTYFTFHHPFFNWVDEELFLEDLASGGNDFCCSVLVNAILAASCHLSDQVQGQAEPWDSAFLGKRFYEEALALWRSEEGKHNLPNLQAALLLGETAKANGEDAKGSNFLSYATNSATNLGLFRDVAMWNEKPEKGMDAKKWKRARSVAVWGLFNYSILTSYSLHRAPQFQKPPKVPMPYENDQSMNKLVFRALCCLSSIHNEIGHLHWSDDNGSSPTSVESTESLYQKLMKWEHELPSPLLSEPDGNWAAGLLQMQFRYIVISLFSPCLSNDDNQPVDQRFYRDRAEKVSENSILALRNLVHLYGCCHGFAFCPVYMSHILLFTASTAMDDLCSAQSRNEVGATEAYASLLECIVGLGEMSKRFFLAQGALKAIQMRAEERGVRLSTRAKRALELITQPDWVAKASDHFRSQYPTEISHAPRGDDPDHARLDNMVKKWNRLAVDEKSSGQ